MDGPCSEMLKSNAKEHWYLKNSMKILNERGYGFGFEMTKN